jgi:tripeptide aminopeptidase
MANPLLVAVRLAPRYDKNPRLPWLAWASGRRFDDAWIRIENDASLMGKRRPRSKPTGKRSPAAPTRRSRTAQTTRGAAESKRAEELVMQLLSIAGPSGQESAVAAFITRQLRHAGASAASIRSDQAHRRTPIDGQCGNLVLKLPGTASGPRRLLSAHMDTVPLCVGCKPKRKGKKVVSADPATGLGADDRAGVAIVLNAALEMLAGSRPHPPLTFLWTVQEEIGLQGARNLRLGLLGKPRLAFNFDGGAPEKLTVGATGGYRMVIDIEGHAAHAGGAPEEGVSAIAIAAIAVARLQAEGWHGDIHKRGRHGTSNVGTIEGGTATNVVADRVRIHAEARSHDPRFRREIVRRIETAFREAASSVRSASGRRGRVRIERRLDYESFLLSPSEPCIAAAEAAVRRSSKLSPQLAVADGGLDANWLCAHGIPTVSLGCGQMDIHTTSEKLDLVRFHRACRIAIELASPQS